ncbi:hypothetical protein BV22DRAFT_412013 [Leucogyrophana mollusca]|uniref:Uncharacterized protein n=1 Tax=Leucogyrophana mollusca TaxID=85980 RepID=A0ACB8BK51_9AGAM|nr:hypothetical protein BV22DRAFT_412013 [Leucogyrophana mollusca]
MQGAISGRGSQNTYVWITGKKHERSLLELIRWKNESENCFRFRVPRMNHVEEVQMLGTRNLDDRLLRFLLYCVESVAWLLNVSRQPWFFDWFVLVCFRTPPINDHGVVNHRLLNECLISSGSGDLARKIPLAFSQLGHCPWGGHIVAVVFPA